MKHRVLCITTMAALILILMVMSGCQDLVGFFHSKENINYTDLVIGTVAQTNYTKNQRSYYKFNAEQGVEYSVEFEQSNRIRPEAASSFFWYDTGGTVSGAWESVTKWTGTVGRNVPTFNFTAANSGAVVVRVVVSNSSRPGNYTILVTSN